MRTNRQFARAPAELLNGTNVIYTIFPTDNK